MEKITAMLSIAVLLAGCADKQIEYVQVPHDVYVPVKCELPMPNKPSEAISPAGLRSILIYTEELECTLHKCRGDNYNCEDK